MQNENTGYYGILNVARNAGIDEIKSAFRKLAHKFHPDKNKGDKEAEEKFKEICRAYEVLSNPRSRMMYDRTRENNPGILNRGWNPEYPFGSGFYGRRSGCGFKRGCGGFKRFNGGMDRNFFGESLNITEVLITEDEARNGAEIAIESGSMNAGRAYRIKLPENIENGAVIRCVDNEAGNYFFVRIRYR